MRKDMDLGVLRGRILVDVFIREGNETSDDEENIYNVAMKIDRLVNKTIAMPKGWCILVTDMTDGRKPWYERDDADPGVDSGVDQGGDQDSGETPKGHESQES